MPRFLLCAALLLAAQPGRTAHAADITPAGEKLAKALDDTHVEKLWLPKHKVEWETGKSLGEFGDDGKSHTHCSAFVAAVAKRHDVYILRPPEHPTVMLANAQFDWLKDDGSKKGWKPVKGPVEAQHLANKGDLVVAAFKEADPKKHGHIAVVRPSTKTDKAVEEEGPQIIQAGMTNYNSTSVKEGFKHHPGAFKDGHIRYFVHKLELK